MKIGITTFGCDLKSGMSRYVTNLITQFSTIDKYNDIEVLLHERAKSEYFSGVENNNIKSVNVSETLKNPLLNVAWHQIALPSICRQRKYDVLFLPAASRRAPVWTPCPTIGTVHDLAAFHVSGKYDNFRNFYQNKLLPFMFKQLTHIIAISESTKRDIMGYVGVPEEKITVIHHAADTETFYPRDKQASIAVVKNYGIRAPYMIYTSRIEYPGKNHNRLIHAFEKMKKEHDIPHQLVLAGADWDGAKEVHLVANSSKYNKDILLTGFVKGDHLPFLYSAADMMVFPSLFEGFGLPILEAMSCGVPVACSNVSSMPEIADGAAVLFDPYDMDSIVDSLLSMVSSQDTCNKFAQKGFERSTQFSWQNTAQKTLDVILNIMEG